MKVYELIKHACVFVGDNVAENIIDNYIADNSYLFLAKEQKIIDKYIGFVNLSVNKIAHKYANLITHQDITTDDDGYVSYASFNNSVLGVLGAQIDDQEQDFIMLPFGVYLKHKNTTYKFIYRYAPTSVVLLDDDVNLPPYISERAISYLMASDIMQSKSIYDESKYFEEKCEKEIISAKFNKPKRSVARYKFM